MLQSVVLNEFFKQLNLWPSEPGEVVCLKHREGYIEPKPKTMLGSRCCLVNIRKSSFMNYCIPNAMDLWATLSGNL